MAEFPAGLVVTRAAVSNIHLLQLTPKWSPEKERKRKTFSDGVEEQVEEGLEEDEGEEKEGDNVGHNGAADEKRVSLFGPRDCWPVVQWWGLQDNQIFYRSSVGKANWQVNGRIDKVLKLSQYL